MDTPSKARFDPGSRAGSGWVLAGAWLAIFVAVVLIAVGVVQRNARDIEHKFETSLQSIAMASQRQVQTFVDERMRDARFLATNVNLRAALQSSNSRPVGQWESRLNSDLQAILQNHQYRSISILDAQRVQRFGGGQIEPLVAPEADALQLVLAQGTESFVDMHVASDGTPCFGVAYPVRASEMSDAPVLGVVYAEVDATKGLFPLILSWEGVSESQESLLLRYEGQDIVYLSPLRFRVDASPLSVRRPLAGSPYAEPARFGWDAPTIVFGRDYRNQEVVSAAIGVRSTPWVMVVEIDRSEVNSAVQRLQRNVVLISAVILGLLALGARLLWRVKHMQAQAQQLALDARFSAAREISMDGYLVVNLRGSLLEFNDALVRITGTDRAILLQRPWSEWTVPEARQALADELERVRAEGAGHFTTQWIHSDGHSVQLQVSATFLPDVGGGTFQAFLRDRGPELQDLARIQRLQSYYAFLSHVNAAIFNLRNEEAILDAVCTGAVRDGGFILAWAGKPDNETGRVVPVVAAGSAADYVRKLLITTDPSLSTSHGPTRLSMVERTIHYVDDFQADRRTHPWHALGREYGFHSSAAVPVLVGGRAVAVLTFYAGARHYFDAELRALLEETARSVSLAFETANAERMREAAAKAHRASEERFARVFEVSPLPMQIISLETRQMRAINKAHERTFGYPLSSLPDERAWFNAVYPDPAQRQQITQLWNDQSLPQALAGGSNMVVTSPEIALRCADGSSRIVRGYMSVVGDDIVVQWEDLTDIKAAQAKLARDEARFRGLIEQTLTGIYVTQKDRIVYVNPRFCQLVGLAAEDILGRDSLDIVATTPEAREVVLRERARIASGEHSEMVVLPLTSRSGESLELGLQGNLGTWNGEPSLIVMALDVSERARAERKIAAYIKQLEGTMRGTLQAVANMVDLRDPYTSGHERRVGLIAADIALEMGWPSDRCQNLQLIGLVHDIGKIAVPAEILAKPTRLSPLEYEMIKTHAEKGYEILKDVEFPLPIAEIIREHHERMDGSGYPQGLRGEQIRPEARILAVADVMESMASHRPYRAALGLQAALKEIEDHRGIWFDEQVVDAALRMASRPGYQLPQ